MVDKINLQKSYGALNEKLAKTFDESAVRRSFTVPYVEGQAAHEHFDAVGKAALQTGGLGNNLLTSSHHSTGKGWGSGDGETVAHPAEKLRNTIIPKDDEHAKAAIDAAARHLSNIEKLLGDEDPEVMTAKNQLNLVKRTDGAGMNLLDFGVMLLQLMHGPNQAIARAHSGTKDGGHAPHYRAPGTAQGPEEQESAQGDESAGNASEGQEATTSVQAAPVAQAAPSGAAAPASEQVQG